MLQLVESSEELVVELLGCPGWIGSVEDIAGDDEQVDRLLLDLREEEVEELALLCKTVALVEILAKVPVGGVKDFQSGAG